MSDALGQMSELQQAHCIKKILCTFHEKYYLSKSTHFEVEGRLHSCSHDQHLCHLGVGYGASVKDLSIDRDVI